MEAVTRRWVVRAGMLGAAGLVLGLPESARAHHRPWHDGGKKDPTPTPTGTYPGDLPGLTYPGA